METRKISDQRIEAERKSSEAYENIVNSFTRSAGDVKYPDNYGGAYLNEEGKLVVLIATPDKSSGFKTATQEFRELAVVKGDGDILFQEANYSYAYLTELMNKLNELFLKNGSNPDSIWSQVKGFALLDDKNVISVDIIDLDKAKIERFNAEVSDSYAIRLGSVSKFNVAEKNLKAGQLVSCGSIGYSAVMGNQTGFVTAGHATFKNQLINDGTTSPNAGIIGEVTNTRFNYVLDAAFVRTDHKGCAMLNTTVANRTITAINTDPVVGAIVYKEGKSTGLTMGYISSTNASASYTSSGISNNRTGLIKADYLSKNGDSGGILYDVNNRCLGIHIVGVEQNDNLPPLSGWRYAEKVMQIKEFLGAEYKKV